MRTSGVLSLLLIIGIMLPVARSKLSPTAFLSPPSKFQYAAAVTSSRSVSTPAVLRTLPGTNARLPARNLAFNINQRRSLSMNSASTTTEAGNIKVLYDGECPICLYEINWLQKRADKLGVKDMEWIDVADKNYTPDKCAGISYERGMEVMHVVGRDGTIHDSVSAFEILYGAVGLGWLSNLLGNPSFQKVANPVYDFWAQLRLPLTGRPSLEVLLERRRADEVTCRSKST